MKQPADRPVRRRQGRRTAPRVLDSDRYTSVLAAETHRVFACRARSSGELAVWQRAFRARLLRMLGIDRIAARGPCPPEPRLVGETRLADHVREEWTLQSEPGFRLPFFVLRPRGAREPRPLVLTPHGHGVGAKRTYAGIADSDDDRRSIADGERDIAVQAVREGYVAIAPDMRAFASMRLRAEIARNNTSSCQELQLRALLFGRTLIGERVWDIGRLIDYASTRRDVDSSRIVITGNSGGGTISLFAAACDERITVAVPSCYFCTFEHSIGSIRHCACNFVPGMMETAEMYDVAGLIAPRPFLAVAGRKDDIFPYAAVKESYRRLLAIYRVAGAAGRCRLFTGEGGHRYYKAGVWPFVREHLGSVR